MRVEPPMRQPDQRSCGATCLVVAAMLADPAYSSGLLASGRFAGEVLTAHRALSRTGLPWPRALGTQPCALAAQLSRLGRASYGVGRPEWRRALPPAPDQPVAVYVGSASLPRHVVLVVGTARDGLRVFDPASGLVVEVSRAAWERRRLRLSGWDRPWLVVSPRPARRTPA